MLVDRSVHDLLDAFASTAPTPGGGSAAALASAVGASLLMMVAGLPKTRAGSDADKAALAATHETLTDLRAKLTAAVDEDAAAYDRVVAAYKLPKADPADQEARRAAIQAALRAATDTPLGVMRLSAGALAAAESVAAHGHRGAASDIGVACALLRAGLHGARLNVDINLPGVKDDQYTAGVRGDVDRIVGAGAASADRAEALLREDRA